MTSNQQTYLIGIAGPSCSGKTTLASALAAALDSASVLPMDMYYRDLAHLSLPERASVNFDAPGALDWPLLVEHAARLAAGHAVDAPVYDFATHTRSRERRTVLPGNFVVVEGILALHHSELASVFDVRVYVDTPDEVCLARREVRDVRDRGRTLESVRRQYSGHVRPMAERYVFPQKELADIAASGNAPLEESVAAILGHIRRG